MKKFLICGFGSIGKKHFKILKSINKNFSIALLRSGIGAKYDNSDCETKIFTKIEKAMNWEPDAALITSPASCHLDQAQFISKSNIPIFVEKPLGRDIDCLESWRSLANKIILVGYVFRHDEGYKLLKDLLYKNFFGELIDITFICKSWLPDWRPGQDYKKTVSSRKELGGGILLEMSHELDLMESLFSPIKIISSSISNSGLLDIDVEDKANIIAQSASKTRINLKIDFCSPNLERYVKVKGSQGEALWNISKGKFKVHNKYTKKEITLPIDPSIRLKKQLIHFLDCCDGKTSPIVSINDGIKILEHVKRIRLLNK